MQKERKTIKKKIILLFSLIIISINSYITDTRNSKPIYNYIIIMIYE